MEVSNQASIALANLFDKQVLNIGLHDKHIVTVEHSGCLMVDLAIGLQQTEAGNRNFGYREGIASQRRMLVGAWVQVMELNGDDGQVWPAVLREGAVRGARRLWINGKHLLVDQVADLEREVEDELVHGGKSRRDLGFEVFAVSSVMIVLLLRREV